MNAQTITDSPTAEDPTREVLPSRTGPFESTCWTVIFEAARAGTPEASLAFGRLYEGYWPPVYGFLRRQGVPPEEAEDLAQDFFLDLLRRKALEALRPEHGRFRCFVVAALRHFLANARDRARTLKRGGHVVHLSLDADEAERRCCPDSAAYTPEEFFDREWAWRVVERVLGRLQAEHEAAGRAGLFEELRRFLVPEAGNPSHADLARKHGITANAVGVAIHRLRQRYRELLREEIRVTVGRPEDVEDELRHLGATLARHPQGGERAGRDGA